MYLPIIPLCSLFLILNLQLCSTNPIHSGLTDTDVNVLKVLLHRLAESLSENRLVDQDVLSETESLDGMGDTEDEKQPPNGLDEAEIREFFSAKNLKSLRNDSTRRSSGCFGRRMDRIGSMSSLGCNTIGRFNEK
ncbi:natriuretic peptides B [Nothobranchius furzeri]|uniref:natriuretic peptides B n=1 Tax=Nothobranchius furzeri TaxID=105023 RepID=UPI002403E58A|nr:natriuretic peptides B [Nothobranchius furzeri]